MKVRGAVVCGLESYGGLRGASRLFILTGWVFKHVAGSWNAHRLRTTASRAPRALKKRANPRLSPVIQRSVFCFEDLSVGNRQVGSYSMQGRAYRMQFFRIPNTSLAKAFPTTVLCLFLYHTSLSPTLSALGDSFHLLFTFRVRCWCAIRGPHNVDK
jgi:hypothetical protein